jgi:hypothetical protein
METGLRPQRDRESGLAGEFDSKFQVYATRLFLNDLNLKIGVLQSLDCFWKQE